MRTTGPLLLALLAVAAPAASAAVVLPDADGSVLAFGHDGLGVLAYHDRAARDLKVAHCVDTACTSVTTTTVDSAGDVGRLAGMIIGSGGPVISYADDTNQDLKLAFCADALCSAATIVVVDPDLGATSSQTALALGSDGLLLVAYVAWEPPAATRRLKVAHCENAGCTAATITDHATAIDGRVSLAIGGDGRGVILWTDLFLFFQGLRFLHCADVACTAASTPPGQRGRGHESTQQELIGGGEGFGIITIAPNGLPVYAYGHSDTMGNFYIAVVRCLDALCVGKSTQTIPAIPRAPALALEPGGLPRLVVAGTTDASAGVLRMVECLDAGCATHQEACLAAPAGWPWLALDASETPLVAFERGNNVEVVRPGGPCPPTMVVHDAEGFEKGSASNLAFFVELAPAATSEVTVSYSTLDGSALAGLDYGATSGVLHLAPGQTTAAVNVPILPDALTEPTETFELVLTNPSGAALADGRAVGTIRDRTPALSVGDCAVVEGDSGTRDCTFEARLSWPYLEPVSVSYSTSDGTATSPVDYLGAAGAITFAPATLTQTVSISVVGDVAVEPDELFLLLLSNPVNATLDDSQGRGIILDDDATPPPALELSHGTSITADLAADPGPQPDVDAYALAQAPFSSYQVTLDAVSGDASPGVALQRLAADGSTVLQNGTPMGTGPAVSLSFENTLGATVTSQYILVRGADCGSACGPDDTYRLRAYDTTGFIPRFNNAGSQNTVILLQNTSARTVSVHLDFWDAAGGHLATKAATLPPHGLLVLNTATIPFLVGTSGSVTVSHNAEYGALVGKAVALEPSTGFSFDSPMAPKPR
jgi:hypothetical protein